MKSLPSFVAAVALLTPFGMARAQSAGDAIPGRYLVQVKSGTTPSAVAARLGIGPRKVFQNGANGFSADLPPGLLRRVASDPAVAAVVPDRIVTVVGNPTPVRIQKGKPGGGTGGGGTEVIPAGITRVGAVGTGYAGSGVGIAIIDTGLDLAHADLRVGTAGFSAFGGSPQDDHGHGTHVGGTAAARRGNALDVVGVAPEATLYAVKVLNAQGSGSDESIIAGLNWIAANAATVTPPIRVANASLGRPGNVDDNPLLRAAIQGVIRAGVTLVVAAGNDCGMEVDEQVPATYPEVIAVGATTARAGTTTLRFNIPADAASYFTTDGAYNPVSGIGVTISAPGEDQENILKGGRLQSVGILSTRLGGGTTRMGGTSMASPHVAGAAAQIHEKHPGIDAEAVRLRLIGGAARAGTAPVDSPVNCYTFDGQREGVLNLPGALAD